MITTNEYLHQDIYGCAIVVTSRLGSGYETRVIGGNLDGWILPISHCPREAWYNHKWVCKLVKDSQTKRSDKLILPRTTTSVESN